MNKVLFFAREVIPYCNSVGSSIRVVTMAKFFAENGFSVKLLAAKGEPISYFGLEKELAKIYPIYIDDFLQRMYTAKAKAISPMLADPPTDYLGLIRIIKAAIKTVVKSTAIVDVAFFFLPKFIYEALKIIRKESIKIIVVSSPPHSSQILGLVVKFLLREQIYLIVDYRDGWNTFSLFRSKNPFKFWLEREIEKRVLTSADLFAYQSPVVIQQITNLFPRLSDLKTKAVLVRNGYTTLGAEPSIDDLGSLRARARTPFVLGYFGGLDFEREGYRNPTNLLRLLDSVGEKIDLVVYGSTPGVRAFGDYENLTITLKGQVSLQQAKRIMISCDGLMVFHAVADGGDEVIPGKFYEYIDAARPILVYGPSNMECGRMVEEYQIGQFLSVERPSSELKIQLRKFFTIERRDTYIKNLIENRRQFSRESQYAGLIRRLERDLELNAKK